MSFGNFNFGDAVGSTEAFQPGLDELLPAGNHVVKLASVEKEKSSGNYPQLTIRCENGQGSRTDWFVISPNQFSVAKLLGLADAAGIPRPVPGQDIDPNTGELSNAYVAQLVGKQVGVVIREEKDNRPGKTGTQTRIKGYVPAKDVAESPSGESHPFGSGEQAQASTPFSF